MSNEDSPSKDTVLSPGNVETHSDGPDSTVGQTIGNYRVLSVLGRGGFGAVYEAEDQKLHRRVALKFIHQSANAFHSHMFEREAKALATLSKHPHIVQIYSWEEFEGENFFVLEYVGSSASDLLRKFPHGLPVDLAVRFIAECADALQFAHDAGILHRDIKSANILIETDSGLAKVADFGLARIRDASETTIEGSAIGSPAFMAPEQVRGAELSHLCDIYSLGVTLYHLLCGQTPVSGSSHLEVMEKVRNNERVPIGERLPDLPKALVAIVERATAYEPEKRFQSAAELAEALRAVQRGEPVSVPGSRPRRRWWYAAAAAAAAVLLAGIALAVAGGSQSESRGTEVDGSATEDPAFPESSADEIAAIEPVENDAAEATADASDTGDVVGDEAADATAGETPADEAPAPTVSSGTQSSKPNIKKRFKNAFRRNEQ